MDDREPVEIGFRGGQAAVREIRGVDLETANRDRLPAPIAAMTCRARGLIDLLPAPPGSIY